MEPTVVDLSVVLQEFLKQVQTASKQEYDAVMSGGGFKRPQFKADGETINPADLKDIEKLLTRKQLDEWVNETIGKGKGNDGDLMLINLQTDYLRMLQRAFTLRYAVSRTVATGHYAARKNGHGHDKGPLIQSVLEAMRNIVRFAKDQKVEP